MKKLIATFVLASMVAFSGAQNTEFFTQDAFAEADAAGNTTDISAYYLSADGLSGTSLATALYRITSSGHSPVSYSELWTAFKQTDNTADGHVWDMYSNCTFTWGSNQCGNYKSECDCYNREHSVPKSWFGDATPMYTDIVHLVPTDGYVNGRRSNYPFGEVGSATYTSHSGCKFGTSNFGGYSGTVFEPVDEYKGDFARIYFYMVTRYRTTNFTQADGGEVMFTYSSNTAGLTTYSINLLLKWSREDPVSDKETARNNGIESVQGNRNPFVDCPELAEYLWGEHKGEKWFVPGTGLANIQSEGNNILGKIVLADGQLTLTATRPDKAVEYTVYGIDGRALLQGSFREQTEISTNRIGQGLFLLQVRMGNASNVHKILVR